MQRKNPLARPAFPAAGKAERVRVPPVIRGAELEEGDDRVGPVLVRTAGSRDHGEEPAGGRLRERQQADLAVDLPGADADHGPERDDAPRRRVRPGRPGIPRQPGRRPPAQMSALALSGGPDGEGKLEIFYDPRGGRVLERAHDVKRPGYPCHPGAARGVRFGPAQLGLGL